MILTLDERGGPVHASTGAVAQDGLGSRRARRRAFLCVPPGHSADNADNADIVPASPTYPVVIFISGIGAVALQYATRDEDLASHGDIAVGTDTLYRPTAGQVP